MHTFANQPEQVSFDYQSEQEHNEFLENQANENQSNKYKISQNKNKNDS